MKNNVSMDVDFCDIVGVTRCDVVLVAGYNNEWCNISDWS